MNFLKKPTTLVVKTQERSTERKAKMQVEKKREMKRIETPYTLLILSRFRSRKVKRLMVAREDFCAELYVDDTKSIRAAEFAIKQMFYKT